MTPRDLQHRREALGLGQGAFARLLWLDGQSADDTIRRWETGKSRIPGSVQALLHLLQHLPQARHMLERRAPE